MIKKMYFGTFDYESLEGLENEAVLTLRADINGNGKIDTQDYLMLKRAYFGTYTIQE